MRLICFLKKFQKTLLWTCLALIFSFLAKAQFVSYENFKSELKNYPTHWDPPEYINCKDLRKTKNKNFYRLVRGWLYSSDMMFLEELIKVNKDLKVKQAFGFSEFNLYHGSSYETFKVECIVKDNKIEIPGFLSGDGHDETVTQPGSLATVTEYSFEILFDIKSGKYEYKEIMPVHPDDTLQVKWLENSADEKTVDRRLKLPEGMTVEIDKTKGGCEDPSKPREWLNNKFLSQTQVLDFLKQTRLLYSQYEFRNLHGKHQGCYTYGTVFYKGKKHIQFRMNPIGHGYFILHYKNPIEARYGILSSQKPAVQEAHQEL